MAVDLQGNPITTGKPSAETLLHTQLYQYDKTINIVLHTHSAYATTLSKIHKEACLTLRDYEVLKAFPAINSHESQLDIPIFPNTQDMNALNKQVTTYLEQHNDCIAYLIEGHGLYTWGASIEECKRHLEALEFLFECYFLEHYSNQPMKPINKLEV